VTAPHGERDFLLELDWAFIPQRRVFSEAVIEHFDVFEGIASGLFFIEEDLVANCCALVSPVEGLHRGIVVTVSFGAHALPDAKGLEHRFVSVAGIGATSITVVDEAFRQLATSGEHGTL